MTKHIDTPAILSNVEKVMISASEYEQLLRENAELKRLNAIHEAGAENFLTEQLKASQKYEAVKKDLARATTHLGIFMDEFEGQFDNDEQCSQEMAIHYQAAADFMNGFGRPSNKDHINSVYNRVDAVANRLNF